jgi:hypothetical protein
VWEVPASSVGNAFSEKENFRQNLEREAKIAEHSRKMECAKSWGIE